MKEYIESYEMDLINSTELINEGVKSEKILKKKLNRVFNSYRLVQVLDNGKKNPDLVGKKEGDYNIRIRVQPMKSGFLGGASQELFIKVTDANTDEPVEGMNELNVVKIKSSWDEEKITDEINDVLADYRIELTGSNGKIGQEYQKMYAGFKVSEILSIFKKSNASIEDKKKKIAALVSAWNKMSDAQQTEFRKLYKETN